jgi:peptidoglycan/xylan/chitin deacetylase (PgdA/CDA1 family)
MKTFCFHSIREFCAVPPPAAWLSVDHWKEYNTYLRVEPDWFLEFLDRAISEWGADGFCLTFDDAYADVLCYAMTAVQRDVRTIVFAPFGHLGKTIPQSPLRVMTQVELSAASYSDVIIGAHGFDHIDWHQYSEKGVRVHISTAYRALCQFTAGDKVPGPKLLAPPHGSYSVDAYRHALNIGFDEVYGTVKYPAGHLGMERYLANRSGYVCRLSAETIPWPWEK